MNHKHIFFNILIISIFSLSTTCSQQQNKRNRPYCIKIIENTNDYDKIVYDYTHGDPALTLTSDNNIAANKYKLLGLRSISPVIFLMNFLEEDALFYKNFRKAHLEGKSAQYLPRPIPKRNTETLKNLQIKFANKDKE